MSKGRAAFAGMGVKDGEKLWAQIDKKPATNKRQKAIVEGVSRTLAQIEAGEKNPLRGWYVTKTLTDGSELVQATVRHGTKLLPFDGTEGGRFDFYERPEKLADFYRNVLRMAEDGDYNEVGYVSRKGGTATASTGNRGGAGKKRAGWSDERRAADAARRAAAKAA